MSDDDAIAAKSVIINRIYGGFGLSDKGLAYFNKLRKEVGLESVNHTYHAFNDRISMHELQLRRTDKLLKLTLKELGHASEGDTYGLKTCAFAFVMLAPDDLQDFSKWKIISRDGLEEVISCVGSKF